MADQVFQFTNWITFRNALRSYPQLDSDRRRQLLFRGAADAKWPMQATLDRNRSFRSDVERERFVTQLLAEFRNQLVDVQHSTETVTGEASELLARHHGLPSPLLDWTLSPYIAAFFAYTGALAEGTKHAAVWMLDRAKLPPEANDFEIIDDKNLLRYNRRAIQQRAVFVRVPTGQRRVEDILGVALSKFVFSTGDTSVALADLDEMTINDTYLFADVDGAARTAAVRVTLEQRSGDDG